MHTQLEVPGHRIVWGARTYVMGILNLTPDSFSGDGLLSDSTDAPETSDLEQSWAARAYGQAEKFIQDGADLIDIGGESTRPGAEAVGADVELVRVLPVVRELAAKQDVLISIDTYKAEVAEAALEAGAHIINDVWGLRADPQLAEVAARRGVPVILMHNRSSWANAEIKERLGGRYINMPYENLLEDVKRELLESVEIAKAAGVKEEMIILDPGIGFGKTVEQNLELVDRIGEIRALGYPILLGPSRKSFIGYTLNLPTDQRLAGTAAAVALGIARGADIVRVHDVGFMVQVAHMTDAMVRRAHETRM